ncbi:glycosyltransferase family 2 protein [Campylobacter lari]|uniref:glycosyltransferase family 2 protein n=1 Tax=Campylobacter lari TaxID=201 RepID=UPI000E129445|nr:glycosyltransferase family 2 protein [Campylobacter lari]SUX06396.1 sugar transferase [Campylobacter lari]
MINKNTPLISIIIPIYNVEGYLRECLNSVVNQTLKDIEIILINDGSTDNCGKICDEYAINDERIIVIHKENAGLGAAFNNGFDIAKGEYCTIVESDDYIKLDMCEKLYKLACSLDCQVIKSDFIGFEGEGEQRIFKNLPICYDQSLYNKKTNPYLNPNIIINSWNMNQSSLYRMDFIKKHNIRANETKGASYQDIGLWFQILSLASSIYFHHEGFYFYRQDNENASVKNKEKVYSVCDEFEFLDKFLDRNLEHKNRLQDIFYCFKFRTYLWNLKRIDKKYKLEFLYKISQDFSPIYDKLNKKYFTYKELSDLWSIVKDPKKSYQNHFFHKIKKNIIKTRYKLQYLYFKIKDSHAQ